jgi:hypothetical protein
VAVGVVESAHGLVGGENFFRDSTEAALHSGSLPTGAGECREPAWNQAPEGISGNAPSLA